MKPSAGYDLWEKNYYPFGFNGQEQDDDIAGEAILNTAEFWEYDNRLGRRWNLDPVNQSWISPYATFNNNPIMNSDKDGDVILAAIAGFVKGLATKQDNWQPGARNRFGNAFRTSWRDIKNSANIWAGLFAVDKNRSFMGEVWEVVARFTYESPQTVAGFVTAHGVNIFTNVEGVEHGFGATVVRSREITGGWFTLGSFIMGESSIHAEINNKNFQHEFGHYRQSMWWGPLYLPGFAVPSLASASINTPEEHDHFFTETYANRLSKKYLFNRGLSKWDENRNPLSEFVVPDNSYYSISREQSAITPISGVQIQQIPYKIQDAALKPPQMQNFTYPSIAPSIKYPKY